MWEVYEPGRVVIYLGGALTLSLALLTSLGLLQVTSYKRLRGQKYCLLIRLHYCSFYRTVSSGGDSVSVGKKTRQGGICQVPDGCTSSSIREVSFND
jgi:hypothetical protein